METKERVTRANDISTWCQQMIEGPAGLHCFEEHEWPAWGGKRDQGIAEFIIRCLANPDNEGSDYVLKCILMRREIRKEITIVQKAFLAGRSKTSWEQFKKDNDF